MRPLRRRCRLSTREGANITIVERGAAAARTGGPYDGPVVLQAFHPLPGFDGLRPVVGSWIVGDKACGMGLREDATAITGTRSRFVPHVIV